MVFGRVKRRQRTVEAMLFEPDRARSAEEGRGVRKSGMPGVRAESWNGPIGEAGPGSAGERLSHNAIESAHSLGHAPISLPPNIISSSSLSDTHLSSSSLTLR